MNVYMVSHEEMEMVHDLREWISEIIKNKKLANSHHRIAADFAIDLSEILENAMCAEIQFNE
jgi:hypothetical protein